MKTKNGLSVLLGIFTVLFFACSMPGGTGSGGKSGNQDHLSDRSAGSRAGLYTCLEVGSVEVTQEDKDQWHTVTLQNNFTDPVVVMGPVSYNGKQPCTVRVRNIESDQFEFQIDEWDYLDGKHPGRETISYMVVEQGVYVFNDMVIEAKSITGITHEWTDVSFDHAFDDVPVVLAQCASYNGKAAVTTRLKNVSAAGFRLKLQEQEANEDYHPNAEQVCVIAFEPSTGSDTIIISHASMDDTWQIVEFDQTIPSAGLFAQMQTYAGNNTCALRYRNLTEAGCELRVQEEQSADEETDHNAENVGYMVIQEGVYYKGYAVVASDNSETNPVIAWNNQRMEYGILWVESLYSEFNRIKFMRMDENGNAIGEEIMIADGYYIGELYLIYHENNFAAVWISSSEGGLEYFKTDEIYMTILDDDGSKIPPGDGIIRITENTESVYCPSIVWSGTQYGITWQEGSETTNYDIYFTRISSTGNKIGENIMVTDGQEFYRDPCLVWNGNEYCVAFSNRNYLDILHITTEGVIEEMNGSIVGYGRQPSFLWKDNAYSYVSVENYTRLLFGSVDKNKHIIINEKIIAYYNCNVYNPILHWTGTEYGLFWCDHRFYYHTIWYVNIDSDGNRMREDICIQTASAYNISNEYSAVWNGMDYGVVWSDDSSGDSDIYFLRFNPN
jgi:hypothetical protein